MAPAQLPSSADFSELSELAIELSETDFEQMTTEELLEALVAICQHPARVFLCRVCDLVTVSDGDE